MVEHRNPPKPANWDKPTKGTCRFCAQPVLNPDGTVNYRTYWHPICVVDYKMVYWPAVTKLAVWMRDEGKCFVCGHQCAQRGKDVWHLDHIRPLVESQGDITYWQMGNLQTLCQPCHTAKTSREATERAAARRQVKLGEILDPTLFTLPQTNPAQQIALRDKIFAKEQRGKPRRPPRRRR